MRIATYNVKNLRLRRDGDEYLLDGASDSDASALDRSVERARADRHRTAEVIANAAPDVVALQEVFDLETLDFFHEHFLRPAGSRSYEHRYCVKGNDGRGRNVAALSVRPAHLAESHAAKTGADLHLSGLPAELDGLPILRRDCLELHFGTVAVFVCHFKAPYPDPKRAQSIRAAEARAVRRIIEARFPAPDLARWILLGDFNEPVFAEAGAGSTLAAFSDGFALDLLDRLQPGRDWTYEVPETHLHTRPDRIMVSPRLAQEFPDARPTILRTRMAPVDDPSHRPRASDHALVYADFPGL